MRHEKQVRQTEGKIHQFGKIYVEVVWQFLR